MDRTRPYWTLVLDSEYEVNLYFNKTITQIQTVKFLW